LEFIIALSQDIRELIGMSAEDSQFVMNLLW